MWLLVIMQSGIQRQQSLREKLKSSLCCFTGTSLDHREGLYNKLRIPKTPISPSGSTTSSWFKPRSPTNNEFVADQSRVRGRSLKSRMGRKLNSHHRQSQSADFSYDPSSYALNFENESPEEMPLRNFSSRLPASPQRMEYSGGIAAYSWLLMVAIN